jgi:serine/threonine protein kinase
VRRAPASLAAGSTIAGRFTVHSLAGRGGMGAVYRATDEESGQVVALKVLHADMPAAITTRFIHEAQILSELRHPGIVQHVAHGRMVNGDGEPYLAMAWLEGEDLSVRLTRSGLTATESVTLIRATAAALSVAHRRGIVHRAQERLDPRRES